MPGSALLWNAMALLEIIVYRSIGFSSASGMTKPAYSSVILLLKVTIGSMAFRSARSNSQPCGIVPHELVGRDTHNGKAGKRFYGLPVR